MMMPLTEVGKQEEIQKEEKARELDNHKKLFFGRVPLVDIY